eukprot:TRINITY_DN35987_c0_g1_i1.p1 TRINITY_DN35987_c0_g1~~TRINITY_DN35987_c0_g1_i1.p1  ORF type:complete len:275 (+),score=31.89 TRINITY_DN35987_c0_g1_i1:257-1081(+)
MLFFGTIPASILVTRSPWKTKYDFEQKGTLSNATQDIKTPHGRLWSVALFTAALLMLNSMYTYTLYRPWIGSGQVNTAMFGRFMGRSNLLSSRAEKVLRTTWVVLPNVGLLLTAVIPSLSGVEGYTLFLTAVHNICAPLSMAFLVIMETLQLKFGEEAFSNFFSTANIPGTNEPLNDFQRLRVLTVLLAWTSGMVFVSIQGYLILSQNRRYSLALISYLGEVVGLILTASLPMFAGIDIMFHATHPLSDSAISYMSTLDQRIYFARDRNMVRCG